MDNKSLKHTLAKNTRAVLSFLRYRYELAMSREVIAIRELEYAAKGKEARCRLTVKVFKPYLLQQGEVSFNFSPGTSGCKLEFEGLDTKQFDTVFYGADMLQALQFAADVEPILKRISQDYDLYFETGEPYFE